MTATRGLALLLTVSAAGALVNASAPSAHPRAVAGVRLKAISAHVTAKGASLVIEASEPVAYVASRPDPLTVLLDFKNVAAEGVANSVAANDRSPITSVTVEPSELLGAPASRVRVTLAQAVAHKVRSARNNVIVEFDKPVQKPTPIAVQAPATGSAPEAMLALQERSQPAAAAAAAPAVKVVPASTPTATPTAAAHAQAPATSMLSLQAQPPAPPPAQPGNPMPPQTGGKQYFGNPVSLDFSGADLRSVLRVFADISGLNIVIDPSVNGTVDVALKDVPWDQALDIILKSNKLSYTIEGTIVRIAPITVLAEEQTQVRKLAEEQALAGKLEVRPIQLSYAKADDMIKLVTKSLSARGTAEIDARTNTLIVTDLPERIGTIADLIGGLDRPQPQVEIEARIIQTNKDYARALGISWGFNGRVDPALGNTTNLAFPNNINVGGRVGEGPTNGAQTQGPGTSTTQQPVAVNLTAPNATSAVGLALGSVNGAFNLDVALSALERSGNGRLLSTPRVTTQNNVQAEMVQGVEIPIQVTANNTVTVTFKPAALQLTVTPQITAANTVIMLIQVENSSPDFSRAVNNIPPINTQRARTQVLVSDGQTTVIGGIYVSQEQAAHDRTPGLSRVPLLNWLFRRETETDSSTELLIFITPRIIRA